MSPKKNYYITTPIYYVNDRPHTGHAYTTIACDALARFKRLDGYNVKFLTGTDEHGQKVAKAAQDKGITPQKLTDKVSESFKGLAETLSITNDDFIRTTENRHLKACQFFWDTISNNNAPDGKPWITLDKYAGWYSLRDEAYHTEDELTTNNNGEKIAPNGNKVEWVEEESYFFRLSAAQDILLKLYEENPNFIGPKSRRNEVISFVKSGLKDISISRTSFNWGIPVPGNQKHVMYVWIDALTNYLTGVGYPDKNNNDYKKYWPADLHIIGKDIIRFHCVYWPAFLLAAKLPLPKRIFAHGWWTIEGQKMSKSLGNAIDPNELVKEFGLDQLRYFLLKEVTFGNDGDFSRQALIQRSNNELANEFGNLVQRVLSMIHKNCDAVIPIYETLENNDKEIIKQSTNLIELIRVAVDKQSFSEALDKIWITVRGANSYVDKQAPWELKKNNIKRMNTVLYTLSKVIYNLAIIMQPFTPEASNKILSQLSVPKNDRDFSFLFSDSHITPGLVINKPEPVFNKIDYQS
jgi:methionyl-tRNA synthetase